jgi:hypothetical protein
VHLTEDGRAKHVRGKPRAVTISDRDFSSHALHRTGTS